MDARTIIRELLPQKSLATLRAYASDLEAFTEYMNQETAAAALAEFLNLPESQANLVMLHYKSELLQTRQKPTSINRKLSTIRSIVKAAKKSGQADWELDIRNEKLETPTKNCLPDTKQIADLMQVARSQKNKIKAVRDYAILCLLYDLALKRNYLVDLQLSNLDMARCMLTFQLNHNQPIVSKKLPTRTLKALKDWLNIRGSQSGPLFFNIDNSRKNQGNITSTSIYRIVRDLGNTIGIKLTPELIRRTAIEQALLHSRELGLTDHDVLSFTNHQTVQSLRHYKNHKLKVQQSLSALLSRN